MSGFVSLELQILSINILGLAGSTLEWSWLKWDRQLEKISNFTVLQPNELEVENIDWLKTIIQWIVLARNVIDYALLAAYVVNFYTIFMRSRPNLLVVWMVLSFFKDIVLEVVVIVITFLLWHKGNVPTSLLIEFITEKTIGLIFSTYKWYTTLQWYIQLRRAAEFRRFTIIARRSIASIVNIPGRVGHSLDDEYFAIAIIRRSKYASLLNLDRFSVDSSSRANAKSLTTLVTDDTSDANDYNSDVVNDLSVAEKSMRMLNVTAEDVMDARARIQERSYWDERDAIAETPEVIEEVVAQIPSKKGEEETIDTSRNKQPAKNDLEKTVDRTLKKENVVGNPTMKKEVKEKENDKIVLNNGKEEMLTENQENVSLVKNENVIFDKADGAKSMESRDIHVAPKKKRKKEEGGVAKIMQCPSSQSKNARMETKPCASLVRKLEAKLYPVPINQQEKSIDRVDRHSPCQVDTQLMPTGSDDSKKERSKNSKISCACHRALRNSSKNGKHARSIDVDSKNVEYDTTGIQFRSFTPIVNMQRSKVDKSAFRYSEAYRLKKQMQKWEESQNTKESWGSKSLAQTARPSGYAKNVIDPFDKFSTVNCRKNIQTETCDESMMMSDSLSERYRLKREQIRSKRSADLRSVYNMALFREENYAEVHETKMKAIETCNNFMLPITKENTRETKARKRHNLLPANRKLSVEQCEAIELRGLRAYNELTSSEDKRELEVRKERDLSLNYGRSTKESEETEVLKTSNDPTLPEDKIETERTKGHNLSPSSQQSVDERNLSRVRNELARSGSERELRTRRKRDSSRNETPSECEEDVETPTSVSNRLSIGSCDETAIPTRQIANSNSGLNDRYARQAHMSLNLWEITRNIEWIAHPRGVILTNKNLHGRFLENERFRESRQRDIADDNTASMLHSAFFFKPESITWVFQRSQNQRIDEVFPSFPILRREDFNTEFVCRMSNELIIHNRDLLDCDLERRVGNDRNNLGNSVLSNINDNRGTEGEHGYDLCVIFVDQEQVPSESETTIEASTIIGSQEDARLSVESTRATNILIFDDDQNRVGNVTNDNLPRLIVDLRNFGMSGGNIRDVVLPIEECEDVSNVNIYNNPQPREFNTDAVNPDRENINESERISSHENVDVDGTNHEIEQILNSSENCVDNVNITAHVSSLEKLNNSRDKKYFSTTDIQSENEICENNLSLKSTDNDTTSQLSTNNNKQFDTLDNKTEKSMFNPVFKNSSKLSLPGPSSFIESENCHALRSCDEELQKLTQFSDSVAALNNQRKESVSNLEATNYDTLSQLETLKLETMQDSARSKINVYEDANEFLTEKLFKMHSDDKLQQDDSFYFTYKRNNEPGTPVSVGNGSLMEEFLNDPISPLNSTYS